MNEERGVTIYGLVCPVENKVMYVGKSIDADVRLAQHIYFAKRGDNTRKDEWLRQLFSMNLQPSIVILDVCTENESCNRERYWISHHQSLNAELKNSHSGSAGGKAKSGLNPARCARIDEGRLNTAMKAANLETDKDLATASGVDERTIRNIKSNGSGSFEVWTKLAEACGCNPIDLLVTPGFPDPNWAALAALSI